jgi:NADPH-dependent 2,4-dienoyl-CoA reductase/sulfur reductase-like enzyme
MDRRQFIQSSAGVAGLVSVGGLAGCTTTASAPAVVGTKSRPKVVVIGAGFGGATCGRYIKMWEPHIEVTLIESNNQFYSCPTSNDVIAHHKKMDSITFGYDNLKGIIDNWVTDTVTAIDTNKKTVTTAGGKTLSYDRLVLAGGVHLEFDKVKGYNAEAQKTVKHAWKASPDQTGVLAEQLAAMPDGGVFVMSVPKAPYRCPPGPYERASLVASYFKKAKPKSKIIVLDGNEDLASKKGLFLAAWKKHYGYGTDNSMIDYRPNNMPRSVNAATKMVGTEFDDVKGDVINVVPTMIAADICRMANVRRNMDGTPGPWCPIDFRTYESMFVKDVHVIGDSALSNFPKSGSMANNMAKVCAASIAEMCNGRDPVSVPVVANTCYSATSGTTAMHVAAVFRYNDVDKNGNKIPGGEMKAQSLPGKGLSDAESEIEHAYMEGWKANVIHDTLAL